MRVVGFLHILSVLAFAALALPSANAQETDVAPATPINILDGQRFAGKFVPSGKTFGRPDVFIFAGGKFHSRECLKFGFTPGPYWVRVENNRLHFFARLTNEENGVMIYQGAIAGAEIDARVEWIKPRWYWTMKRNFRFRGTSSTAGAAGAK